MKPAGPVASWESPPQAWAMTQGQRAYYETLSEIGEMAPIRNLAELDAHLELWSDPVSAAEDKAPVGYILSLEGADSIVTIDYLEKAWEYGLRAMGASPLRNWALRLWPRQSGATFPKTGKSSFARWMSWGSF